MWNWWSPGQQAWCETGEAPDNKHDVKLVKPRTTSMMWNWWSPGHAFWSTYLSSNNNNNNNLQVPFRQRNTSVPHVNISRVFCSNFVHKTHTEHSPGKTKDSLTGQRCYITCRQIFFPDVTRYNTNEECIRARLLLSLPSISFGSRHAGRPANKALFKFIG